MEPEIYKMIQQLSDENKNKFRDYLIKLNSETKEILDNQSPVAFSVTAN